PGPASDHALSQRTRTVSGRTPQETGSQDHTRTGRPSGLRPRSGSRSRGSRSVRRRRRRKGRHGGGILRRHPGRAPARRGPGRMAIAASADFLPRLGHRGPGRRQARMAAGGDRARSRRSPPRFRRGKRGLRHQGLPGTTYPRAAGCAGGDAPAGGPGRGAGAKAFFRHPLPPGTTLPAKAVIPGKGSGRAHGIEEKNQRTTIEKQRRSDMNELDGQILRRLQKQAKLQGFIAENQIRALSRSDEEYGTLRQFFVDQQVQVSEFVVKARKPTKPDTLKKLARYNDPTWVYLNSVGKVPLLSREEEINIAKRIEEVQKRIGAIIFRSKSMVAAVLDLGRQVVEEDLRIEEILQIDNDAWTDPKVYEAEKEPAIAAIMRLAKHYTKLDDISMQYHEGGDQ